MSGWRTSVWTPGGSPPLILLAYLLLGFLLAALTQRFGPRSYLLPSLLYLCLIFLPQAEWLRDVRLLLPAALLLAAGVAWSLVPPPRPGPAIFIAL